MDKTSAVREGEAGRPEVAAILRDLSEGVYRFPEIVYIDVLAEEVERLTKLCDLFADGAQAQAGALVNAVRRDAALRAAVSDLYYAAHWTPDRPCDADALWTRLRDAAGLTPGNAPAPAHPEQRTEDL